MSRGAFQLRAHRRRQIYATACVGEGPRATHAAKLFGHGKAGLQTILMEARAEVGPAEPDTPLPLQAPQLLLRLYGRRIEDGVLLQFAA